MFVKGLGKIKIKKLNKKKNTMGSQTQGNSERLMFANGISLLNLRSCSLPREIKNIIKKYKIL